MSKLSGKRPSQMDKLIASVQENKRIVRLVVDIEEDLHHEVKKFTTDQRISIKNFVSKALKEALKQ